jgi:hypothetical protein
MALVEGLFADGVAGFICPLLSLLIKAAAADGIA